MKGTVSCTYLENCTHHIKKLVLIRNEKGRPDIQENSGNKESRLFPQRYAEKERPSWKGRRVDALALGAEERRGKLRKAAGRSKHPVNRRCLNVETRQGSPLSSMRESIAHGGEPWELKHLSTRRKRKKHRCPK